MFIKQCQCTQFNSVELQDISVTEMKLIVKSIKSVMCSLHGVCKQNNTDTLVLLKHSIYVFYIIINKAA